MNRIMELADDYAQLLVQLETENNEHGTVGSESIQWVDEARAALVAEVERVEAEFAAAQAESADHIQQLRKEQLTVQSMRAELAAAQADVERMDWIAMNGTFGVDSVTGKVGGNGQTRKAATRKQIDAAMKETK